MGVSQVSVAGFSELRLQGKASAFGKPVIYVSVAGFSELRLQAEAPLPPVAERMFQLLVSLN